MSIWWRAALLAWLSVAIALPAQEARSLQPSRNSIQPENDIYSDCFRKDSATCFKLKLFSLIDRLSLQEKPYVLTEGFTVVKTAGAEKDGAPRSLTGDESLESLILSRVQSFLDTHTLKFELQGSDVVNAVSSTGRALEDATDGLLGDEEGRGKKKKASKILGPLLAAVALKAAALLPLVLGAIALIAGKALLVGKLALVLSAIIGLKKLLSQQKHVTYEVVAHPHHSSSHSSGHTEYSGAAGSSGYGDAGYASSSSGTHGGWGRAIDAQEQAYAAQRPQQ